MSGYCQRVSEYCASIAVSLARTLLPEGSIQGRNWVAKNPTREDKNIGSFSVIVLGESSGVWKDFATGDGGSNFISLVMYIKRRQNTREEYIKTAKELAQLVGCDDE